MSMLFFFFMTKKLCIAMRPLIEPVLMWSHYITTMVRNQGHSDATIVFIFDKLRGDNFNAYSQCFIERGDNTKINIYSNCSNIFNKEFLTKPSIKYFHIFYIYIILHMQENLKEI